MPRNNRQLEPDLRPPYESFIQPNARPVDSFQQAHGAPYRAELTDFSALSQHLASGAAELELGGAEKQQELGAAEFQKALQEAQAGTDDLAGALSKAVSNGSLLEQHNPYFITGYRRAAAREFATRWYGESIKAIEANGATAQVADPNTGVVPAVPSGAQLSSGILQRMMGDLRKVNPALVSDPWFTREFGKAQAHYGAELALQDARTQGQALSAAARNTLAAEYSNVLPGILGKAGVGPADYKQIEDMNADRLRGMKDPQSFMFGVVAATTERLANEQGPQAALDFLHNAGNIVVGSAPLNRGTAAGHFESLVANMGERQRAEEHRATINYEHEKQAFTTDFLENSPLAQAIFGASSSAEASAILNANASKVGNSDIQDPMTAGIPPKFRAVALGILRQEVAAKDASTQEQRYEQLGNVEQLIADGHLKEAEVGIAALSGQEKRIAMKTLTAAKHDVAQYMDNNPAFSGMQARINNVGAQIDQLGLGDAETAELQEAVMAENTQHREEYRSALKSLTSPEDKANFAATGAGYKSGLATLGRVQSILAAAQSKVEALEKPISEALAKNEDPTSTIRNYQDAHLISPQLARVWLTRTNQELSVRRSLDVDAHENPFVTVKRDVMAHIESAVIKDFERNSELGLVQNTTVQNPYSPGQTMVVPKATPAGRAAFDDVVGQVKAEMQKWWGSPEAIAIKNTKGELGLAQAANDQILLLGKKAIGSMQANGPTAPIDFSKALPKAEAPKAAGVAAAESPRQEVVVAPSRPPDEASELIRNWDWSRDPIAQAAGQEAAKYNGGSSNGLYLVNTLSPEHTQGHDFIRAERLSRFGTYFSSASAKQYSDSKDYGWLLRESPLLTKYTPDAKGHSGPEGNFYHPYPLGFFTLAAFRNHDPEALELLRQAHENNGFLLAKVSASSATPQDKWNAAADTTRLLGIYYKDVIRGAVTTAGKDIPITDPNRISWQYTPLFANQQELHKVMKDPAMVTALFKGLGLDYKDDAGVKATMLAQFMKFQTNAISRIE